MTASVIPARIYCSVSCKTEEAIASTRAIATTRQPVGHSMRGLRCDGVFWLDVFISLVTLGVRSNTHDTITPVTKPIISTATYDLIAPTGLS